MSTFRSASGEAAGRARDWAKPVIGAARASAVSAAASSLDFIDSVPDRSRAQVELSLARGSSSAATDTAVICLCGRPGDSEAEGNQSRGVEPMKKLTLLTAVAGSALALSAAAAAAQTWDDRHDDLMEMIDAGVRNGD